MIDIQKEIYAKYPNLKNNKLLNSSLSKFAKTVVHEKTINEFLNKHNHLKGFEFVDSVLEYFNFNFSVSQNQLENIPTSGRVVIIANHPLGSLDAFTLLKLIGKVRSDVKIVANDFLAEFKSIESLLVTINNFKDKQTKESITKIYSHLQDEGALIIFPAGEVSRMTPKGVRDGKWQKGFLKFAMRTNSPILPIYIGAKNSKTFYSVSTLNKKISTLLLSHEMFKQKNKHININIGELIPSENIHPPSLETNGIVELYRQHVYQLKKGRPLFKTQKAIAHPEDTKHIKKELRDAELLGATKDGKSIYLYSNTEESIILKEIGRLREVAFRKVGEGANQRRDLDKYDKYYKHIVLWDEEDLEIVGSYRIGECKEILDSYGVEGLYNTTLFNFSSAFIKMLPDSIELGRSFVQPKYWGTRALDYLWYGIGAYLAKNEQIKYMFGPVSLSGSYSPMCKDIIFNFYDNYFADQESLVSSKSPYNFKNDQNLLNILDKELLKDNYKEDFKAVKKLLKTFDSSIPVLYKQYAELCQDGGIKFCAYNIDKEFASCVDSFIVVDISLIKDSQRKRYINNVSNT